MGRKMNTGGQSTTFYLHTRDCGEVRRATLSPINTENAFGLIETPSILFRYILNTHLRRWGLTDLSKVTLAQSLGEKVPKNTSWEGRFLLDEFTDSVPTEKYPGEKVSKSQTLVIISGLVIRQVFSGTGC